MNKLVSSLFIVGLLASSLHGQEPSAEFMTSSVADYGSDSVDLQTLVPSIRVPIRTKNNGPLPFAASVAVQSMCYAANTSAAVNGSPEGRTTCSQSGNNLIWNIGHWYISDIAGLSQHPLNQNLTLYDSYCPGSLTATTVDGSGLTATISQSWTGVLMTYSVSIVDKMGNTANMDSSSWAPGKAVEVGTYPFGSHSWTDPFGNKISTSTGTYIDSINPTGYALSTLSGVSGWSYKDVSNTSQQISTTTTSLTGGTQFNCSGVFESSFSAAQVVDKFSYPDGTSEAFGYESTGRLSSITLSTGGQITYSYGPMNCTWRRPLSLSRTTPDGTYTYTASINTSSPYQSTTTVLDPGQNKTIYTFTGYPQEFTFASTPVPVLTQVQTYQNIGTIAAPSYSLLATDLICYNGNTANCASAAVTYPITQKAITHTIAGMSSGSQTIAYYDGGPSSACAHGTSPCYGNVTEVDHYDFGASSPTIQEITSYGSWNGSTCVYIGSNIYGKPCDAKKTSGSNTLSESRYTYSSKGFLTQKQEWTGSSWLVTNYTPNSNGTVASEQAPNGQLVNYGYATSGSGGCNGLLLTSTSTASSGVQLQTSKTWDCNGGLLLSSTDANNNVSQYTYDAMFRPASITDPGQFSLNNSYTYNSVTTAWSMNNGTIASSTTKSVDGLGRFVNAQTTDGNTFDTVSTFHSYNNGPNLYTETSEPCFTSSIGTAGCSMTGMTAYDHYEFVDPLGRSLSKSTNSREVYNSTYSQNDVQLQLLPAPSGEHPKTEQTEYDGLGRLKSTCSLLTSGGTACGQAMGGSGILTSYVYSFANGSTTTAATRGLQNHTVVRDGMGRITSSQTPEAGTRTYIYDIATATCGNASALGALVETVDNAGVHTCLGVDGLYRVNHSVLVFNGISSNDRWFVYGETPYTPPTGVSIQNGKGRIVEAYVDLNHTGAKDVDEWLSYDVDGRVTDVWELTPNSGGYYHTTVGYYQNGLFNSLTGVPGYPAYTVNLDLNGRPKSSTFGSTTVINNVIRDAGMRATSVAIGTAGDNDSYSYDPYTGNMTNYTFSVSGKAMAGTLGWNPNGTLGNLNITDTFNAGGTQSCSYLYDDIGRLGVPPNSPPPPGNPTQYSVDCGSSLWRQVFSYDNYDNLTKTGNPGTTWNSGYNAANNRMVSSSYDTDGRVLYDGVNSYTWDAYGKMTGVRTGNNAAVCGTSGTCITYDAFGRAVEFNKSGNYSQILYGAIGRIGQMKGQTTTSVYLQQPGDPTLYASGTNGSTKYILHSDWLKTKRLATTLVNRTEIFDTAYTPYGESYDTFGTLNPTDFTGDLQDSFKGLFDTPSRELMSNAGRWLSPDSVQASWNAYAYGANPNSTTDRQGTKNRPLPPKFRGHGCTPDPYGGSYCGTGDGWLDLGWDEFDLMLKPVRDISLSYTPPIPISAPITDIHNDAGYAVSATVFVPGGWSYTLIGRGWDLSPPTNPWNPGGLIVGMATASGGRHFEELFRGTYNVLSNSTKLYTDVGNTVPDLYAQDLGIVEVKAGEYVYMDTQLEAQFMAAQTEGSPWYLVVSPDTEVASTVLENVAITGGQVAVFDAETGALTAYGGGEATAELLELLGLLSVVP